MAIDQRQKNGNWSTRTDQNYYETDQHYRRASLAVLMDIRDELQALNRLLGCSNFTNIPRTLKHISANTYEAKQRRKTA